MGTHPRLDAGVSGDDVARERKEFEPRRGQVHGAWAPDEQTLAHLRFEPGDLLTERGRADVQLLGGAGEVQLVGERDEVRQRGRRDVHVFTLTPDRR